VSQFHRLCSLYFTKQNERKGWKGKKKESKLTLNRWSATVHTRLAKSLDAPRIIVPVESKSTDITPALLPTSIPLLSYCPPEIKTK
jgi:hypothetical protein